MNNTPINEFLTNYGKKNLTRCHTPGGKGVIPVNPAHDITEVNGAGDLYNNSANIITESERIAAKLFGAKKTLYSCSGATLAIQTMLGILKRNTRKNKIAAFRYAHRSFVSAAALLDFQVDWIYPREFLSAEISPESVKTAITRNLDSTAAVFVNSLDYYGGMCDVSAVAEICRCENVPLLVDNAHGAYLAFTGNHPITLGAAMSADSAHKTLPALTGAAYLHIADERFLGNSYNPKSIAALFGTSSPSYLILESLDLCNSHIATEQDKAKTAFRLVENLKRTLAKTGFELRQSDALRITVNATAAGFSGITLAKILRENGVECEYADKNCTVLLFSTITTEKETKAVKAAFNKISVGKPVSPVIFPIIKPKQVTTMREALFAPDDNCAYLQVDEVYGKICAEIIAPCPPGVPLVMPGERIGKDEIHLLKLFGVEKIRVLK